MDVGGGGDDEYAVTQERSARQIASLTETVHELSRYGTDVLREGLDKLAKCELSLKRLAKRAKATQGKSRKQG